ncbi:unnamed protein product [Brachionus calyciflorus]|nr:unnamed protein product [Brachionus calyciflorus]
MLPTRTPYPLCSPNREYCEFNNESMRRVLIPSNEIVDSLNDDDYEIFFVKKWHNNQTDYDHYVYLICDNDNHSNWAYSFDLRPQKDNSILTVNYEDSIFETKDMNFGSKCVDLAFAFDLNDILSDYWYEDEEGDEDTYVLHDLCDFY